MGPVTAAPINLHTHHENVNASFSVSGACECSNTCEYSTLSRVVRRVSGERVLGSYLGGHRFRRRADRTGGECVGRTLRQTLRFGKQKYRTPREISNSDKQ